MSTRRLFAAFSACFAVAMSCGGTAVLDSPDPTGCPPGHGCPMVACRCDDGSLALDSTCKLGNCVDEQTVCDDRCAERGGSTALVASQNDEVPIPNCDTFCQRLRVNGCELGCDTVFSECVTPSSCGAVVGLWDCIVNTAVITCDDNTVRIEGCDASTLGLCGI